VAVQDFDVHKKFLLGLRPVQELDGTVTDIEKIKTLILRATTVSSLVRIHLAVRQAALASRFGINLATIYPGNSSSKAGKELMLHRQIIAAVQNYPVFLLYKVLQNLIIIII
jgi:hypothetical protein